MLRLLTTWVLLGSTPISTPKLPCEGSPKIVDPCFMVHGKLQVWNGNPSFRIWPIGTKRLLGVVDTQWTEESPVMPDNVMRHYRGADPTSVALVADFRVCPLTKERPEHMRRVCIESAANIRQVAY